MNDVKSHNTKKIFLIISLIGVVLFSGLFTLTFVSPLVYEKTARTFIESRIQEKMIQRMEETREQNSFVWKLVLVERTRNLAANNRFVERARRMAQSTEQFVEDKLHVDVDKLKGRIKELLPGVTKKVVDKMQDPECKDCRKQLLLRLVLVKNDTLEEPEQSLEESIGQAAERDYVEIVRKLLQDLRIFSGTNLAAFVLLLLGSLMDTRSAPEVAVPGSLLVGAVTISSLFYIFGQDWFFTLMDNDYVGFSYCGYLGIVFLFLCDIVLNKATVTKIILKIIDTIVSSIANALSSLTG